MMTPEKWKGHGFILIANVFFAINLPVSKYLIPEHVSPEALTLLRSMFGCAMFWLVSLFVKGEAVNRKDLGILFFCALCGFALNSTLFMTGLNLTSPVDASIIATAGPIYVMLLAAVVLKEPITLKKAFGVLMGVGGAVLMILTSAQAQAHGEAGLNGAVRIVLSNLLYSVYVVLSRPLSQRYSAVTIMKWVFLFSTVMLLPFMYKDGLATPAFHRSAWMWKEIGALGYVLIFATFIPYMLIPMSLRRLRPTTVSMYNYIQPIIASMIAVLVGQGSFTVWKIVSTLFVFTGVYLVTQSKSREDVEREMKQSSQSHIKE
ncbi:MAG: DMT family transporter [Tannerellaceae bacterium]|jgi:drug/metabolite transporter (DMT)-like permease|nr:DMT family transporter [Tannerellaceae bacterium]